MGTGEGRRGTLPKILMNFYYRVKPAVPRGLQIFLRRKRAAWISRRIRDRWPISPVSPLSPPDWGGWKDGKSFALVLTHDVDTAKGYADHYRLLEIEKEMGFVSAFNFVPERYARRESDITRVWENGFEVGVHGLNHDGKLFQSDRVFMARAKRINEYLKNWNSTGFRAPAMHHDLDLIRHLRIAYDSSTFDTDPFEPQADGVGTIFPFPVYDESKRRCFWELPYTLPQDFLLFIILQQRSIDTWRRKLDWIAANGGMALINTHPDYMNFEGRPMGPEEYPVQFYTDFLRYVKDRYAGRFWNPLPSEMVTFLNDRHPEPAP